MSSKGCGTIIDGQTLKSRQTIHSQQMNCRWSLNSIDGPCCSGSWRSRRISSKLTLRLLEYQVDPNLLAIPDASFQKYSRLRCLLRVQGLVICFYLGWSGTILQFRQNIITVGSKSWLLTCSSNIILSLPSYTGSALKRELNFCNSYLSLLYFWLIWSLYQMIANEVLKFFISHNFQEVRASSINDESS